MRKIRLLGALLVALQAELLAEQDLLEHLEPSSRVHELRGLELRIQDAGNDSRLLLGTAKTGEKGKPSVSWVAIRPPDGAWDLSTSTQVRATVRNVGSTPANLTLWLTSLNGWGASGEDAVIPPGETVELVCKLRHTYPDGTPKLDPSEVRELRFMLQRTPSASLEIVDVQASGRHEPEEQEDQRIRVPRMESGSPAPGRRVKFTLPDQNNDRIYTTLYLPVDWAPGNRYPVFIEFPGNQFFHADKCWSTGRPEDCIMGYGMTQGRGAIWISLPFVNQDIGETAEIGFGSNDGDDTVDYTFRVIDELCSKWMADRDRIFMGGFSRGAIACGYIGLRNDKIAKAWKGFVACQHYDGSGWGPSTMVSAVERAPRFQGSSIFQIDNSGQKYAPVVEATNPKVEWHWEESHLGYHSPAMFLDERPAMKKLRQWWSAQTKPD